MNILLGVNVDHVATIRNVRGTNYPDPTDVAIFAEKSGADGITVHVREDYRHINEKDAEKIAEKLQNKMNLEMANTKQMVELACRIKPKFCCLVPEKREELTTEKGLDLLKYSEEVFLSSKILSESGILVSLFIDPEKKQIDLAREIGVPFIEIHTGYYSDCIDKQRQIEELKKIKEAVKYARKNMLNVNAGHGLNYDNVQEIAKIDGIYELNIGHSIISRSIFFGISESIKKMKKLIIEAKKI
ncbi:pyridoxine 5'-phosphate synthase [Candidatus Riesia sp. GBBU]|nr:pyridoxine 5'-phosphate synthase [Candidatus Riesia sp. GBBU]